MQIISALNGQGMPSVLKGLYPAYRGAEQLLPDHGQPVQPRYSSFCAKG